jgi:hypothetical protein
MLVFEIVHSSCYFRKGQTMIGTNHFKKFLIIFIFLCCRSVWTILVLSWNSVVFKTFVLFMGLCSNHGFVLLRINDHLSQTQHHSHLEQDMQVRVTRNVADYFTFSSETCAVAFSGGCITIAHASVVSSLSNRSVISCKPRVRGILWLVKWFQLKRVKDIGTRGSGLA